MKSNRIVRPSWLFALLLLAAIIPSPAATRVWLCQWANNNWATATNWAPTGLPQHGDDLVFPAGVRFDSINNFATLRLNSITVTGGAQINGNAITVSNALTWSGAGLTDFNLNVTLGSGQTWTCDNSSLHFGGDVNLNGFNLNLNFEDFCEFRGSLTGAGPVVKSGNGQLILGGSAPNTFNGLFTHLGGELWAAKSPCFPGGFTSFGHTVIYSSGVFSPNHSLTLQSGAFLECSRDETNTVAHLIMTGARIIASPMTLSIRSNLIVNAATTNSEIITRIDLGNSGHVIQVANGAATPDLRIHSCSMIGGANAGFTKTGPGTLCLLQMAGSYGGLTTISNGVIELLDIGTSLGNSAGRTIVHSNTTLRLLGPANQLFEPLELHGTGVNGTNGALEVTGGGCSQEGTITVPFGATIRCENPFHARGALAGAGDIRFNGSGEFWTHGEANTLTGDLIIESGLFMMGKVNGNSVNPNSTIIVGTNGIFGGGAVAVLRNWESNQVTGPVLIRSGSRWEVSSGTFEGAPDITMLGNAEIYANGGTFQLDGTLTVQPQIGGSTARIHGGSVSFGSGGALRTINVQDIGGASPDNIELLIDPTPLFGSAPVLKTGSGDLRIAGQHVLTSVITVEAGDLRVDGIAPLGQGGNTIVSGTGRLVLEGATFDQEPLIINGSSSPETGNVFVESSSSWRAPITLNAPLRAFTAAGQTWTVNSPIAGSSAFQLTGPGMVLFDWDTTNTYTGGTWVRDGELRLGRESTNAAIPGTLTIGDGTGAAGSARLVVLAPNEQIANSSDVILFPDGRFILTNHPTTEIIRTLAGSGEIVVSNATLRLNDGGSNTTFSGALRGNGGLIKAGAGTLTLAGNNFGAGLTLSIFGGAVALDGNWSAAAGARIDAFSGTVLEGDGTAQNLNIRGGATLAPGHGDTGRLIANDVTLLPSANLFMQINGAVPGNGHDQLVVNGDLSLTNALLTLAPTVIPTEGQTFMLVDNRAVTPVHGTFSGRPQGSVFTENRTTFVINYAGGDGNDITLTVTNTELALASVLVLGGNGNGRIDAGECNELQLVLSNKTGLVLSGIGATLDSLTPGVGVVKATSAYPPFPTGASRTNLTPFRLTIAPEFDCGAPVNLRLTVNAGTLGSFSIPVSLPSGVPGIPKSFAPIILGSLPIPDQGRSTSFVAVANFPERIARATVSLHATHSFIGDLVFTLRAPSGRTVTLSSRRGTGADSYGTNCAPEAARTTFDDAAAVSIINGSAPFVGSYRPAEPLAGLIGEEGAGTWALIVEDAAANDIGALLCWRLNLTPATCSGDATSDCESCTPVVTSDFSRGPSNVMFDRLSRDGRASLCGEAKACPGPSGLNTPLRYRTHTFTNPGPATCVTALLRSACTNGNLFLSAYAGAFNPSDLCAQYLGDSGVNSALAQMSFLAPANSIVTLVVNEVAANSGCSAYSLEVHGLPCPPPLLQIAPVAPGRVRLSWNQAAGEGYSLQSASNLLNGNVTPFVNVPATPIPAGGTLTVTNDAAGARSFYRLIKP